MSYKYVPELNPQKPNNNNNNKSSSTLGLSFLAIAWGDRKVRTGDDSRRWSLGAEEIAKGGDCEPGLPSGELTKSY